MITNLETASVSASSSGSSIIDANPSDKSVPIFLQVGTPVSAKYRGAYCEAKVEKVKTNFRIRATLQEDPKTSIVVEKNNFLSGSFDINSVISVKWPLASKDTVNESNKKKNAIVQKVFDMSTYTVVFDDGDKRCLKRSQLVIKGARHFKEGESLDQLPLTNPDHFKHPVVNKKATMKNIEDVSDPDDNSDLSGVKTIIETSTLDKTSCPKSEGSDDRFRVYLTESPLLKRFIGRVVMVDMPVSTKNNNSLSSSGLLSDQSGNLNDSSTFSRRRRGLGLVCIPSADPGKMTKVQNGDSSSDEESGSRRKESLLIRLFKDGKFSVVPIEFVRVLNRHGIVELAHQSSTNQQVAFERAILWYDRRQLPIQWLNSSTSKSLGSSFSQIIEVHLGTLNWRSILKEIKVKEKTIISTTATVQISPSQNAKNIPAGSKRKGISIDQKKTKGNRSSETKIKPKRKRSNSNRLNPKAESSDENEETKEIAKDASESSSSESDSSSSDDFLDTSESSSDEGEFLDLSDSSKQENEENRRSTLTKQTQLTRQKSNSSNSGSNAEHFEARDRWIANLYRFMEERGTPINKAPSIGNKDLDLFRLHKLVQSYGGFHRVSNNMFWITIFSKLGLPPSFTAGSKHLQAAYKKYLYPLDDLNRKLGANLDTSLVSSTGRRTTHNSGNSNSVQITNLSPNSSLRPTEEKHVPIVEPITSSGSLSESIPKKKSSDAQLATPSPPHLIAESPVKVSISNSYGPSSYPATPNIDNSSPNFSGYEQKSFDSYQPDNISDFSSANSASKKKKSESEAENDSKKSRKRKKNDEPCTPIKNLKKDFQSTPNKMNKNKAESSGSPPELKMEKSLLKSDSSKRPSKLHEPLGFSSEPNSLNTSLLDMCQTTFDQNRIIPVGSRVFVRFAEKFYPGKIIRLINKNHTELRKTPEKMQENIIKFLESTNPSDINYKVHYLGWNTRHDEIVERERIVKVIEWAPNVNRPPSSSSMNFGSCGCMDEREFDLKTSEDGDKLLPDYDEIKCDPLIRDKSHNEEEVEEGLITQESLSLTSNTPSASSSPAGADVGKTKITIPLSSKDFRQGLEPISPTPIEETREQLKKEPVVVEEEEEELTTKPVEITDQTPLKRKAGRPRKTNKFTPESSFTRKQSSCTQHILRGIMNEEDTASDIVTTSAAPVFRYGRGRHPKLYGKLNRISISARSNASVKADNDSDSRASTATPTSGRRPRGRPPGKSKVKTPTTKRDSDSIHSSRSQTYSRFNESDSETRSKSHKSKKYKGASDSDLESNDSGDESNRLDENGDALPRLTRRQHKMILGDENDKSDFEEVKSSKSSMISKLDSAGQNDLDNTVEAVLSLSRNQNSSLTKSSHVPVKTDSSDVEDHLSPLVGHRVMKEDDITSLGSTIVMNNLYDICMNKDDVDMERRKNKSSRSSIGSFSSNTSLDENALEEFNNNLKGDILSPSNTVDSSNAPLSVDDYGSAKDQGRVKSNVPSETSSTSKSAKRPKFPKKIKSDLTSIESGQSSETESNNRLNEMHENIGSPATIQKIKEKQMQNYSSNSPKLSMGDSAKMSTSVHSSEYNNLHGPFQRRFGGPYFPIPGLESLPSDEKCQALQLRMRKILDAWRLAKQFQKDLDPRASRSKRNRAAMQLLSMNPIKSAFNNLTDNQISFS